MILIFIGCLALAVVLGVGYYAYRIAFFSPAKGRDAIPSHSAAQYDPYREEIARLMQTLSDRPCETVTICAQDGKLLSGRYYHVRDGAPLDIGFHGYRSSYLTDFSGGAELSRSLGHNLLLVDQRAHGKSQGRTITFGIQERWDVISWVDYAVARFGPDTRILLLGVSMGASTVLMASGLELPPNVRGIIADCPYNSPKDIILRVAEKMGFSPRLIWPFVVAGAHVYGGFSIRETTAAESVKNASVPILILHGEADRFVPWDMSRQISLANPERIRLFTFPGAEHGLCFLADSPRYRQLVTDFMEAALK